MEKSEPPDDSLEIPLQRCKLSDILRWLTEPSTTLSEPDRRRSRVLASIILVLFISAVLFLVSVFLSDDVQLRGPYSLLIAGLLGVFTLSFSFNHLGLYSAAAGLIIASTVLGIWVSILINLATLTSDYIRLSYITVSVVLCSFLLSTRATIILAVLQLAVLELVLLFSPFLATKNWSSLVGYILFMSLLSIVSNYITRRDLDQIDQQTRQLRENEARLRELSIRDPLTGLFNRRYLDETLDRELNRVERKGLSLGIIMLDIDNFKNFNDFYGHAAGDMLLQRLGLTLKQNIRAADIACRYGGEEFILILPEATQEVTRERAEHMREDVRNLLIHFENQELRVVTLSLGVAVFPLHGSTKEAVLRAADDALYQAKREGRDRVIVANNE